MANEDTVLKEVDQELAEERQWAMFRKYGSAMVGASVAIVVAVGAWQFWNINREQHSKAQALEFRTAVEQLEENSETARASLAEIASDGASGYAILAEFHRAASFARDGDRLGGIAAYSDIYENSSAPRRLRELARLRAAYLALNEGRDAVLSHLADLADSENPFFYHASEISGLAALQAKDYETALAIFRRLSTNIVAPEPVRVRAEDFAALALSGKSGVNLTGEARVEDLLKAIEPGQSRGVSADSDEAAAALLESILTDGGSQNEEDDSGASAIDLISSDLPDDTPATNNGNE